MTRHMTTVGAGLLGAVIGAGILLGARRLAKEPHLPTPGYLPAIARGVLKNRMARHAEHMTALVQAVVLFDRPTIVEEARAIAEESTLARPTTDDATELNALLPARFFELQDELRKNARRLATASQGQDAEAVADAHAELTRTCVRCHATYLGGPGTTPAR